MQNLFFDKNRSSKKQKHVNSFESKYCIEAKKAKPPITHFQLIRILKVLGRIAHGHSVSHRWDELVGWGCTFKCLNELSVSVKCYI